MTQSSTVFNPRIQASLLLFFFLSISIIYVQSAPLFSLIYPLYADPLPSTLTSLYAPLNNASYTVPTVAIINPGNGDTNSCPYNSDFSAAFNTLSNTMNIGYVYTSYSNRSLLNVTRVIDNYYTCWNSSSNNWAGIFLDQASSEAQRLPYYCHLYNYTKSISANSAQVWISPGTTTDESYINCSDVIVTAQMNYVDFVQYIPSNWTWKYPSNHFATIIQNVPPNVSIESVATMISQKGFGYGMAFAEGYVYTSESLSPFFTDFVIFDVAYPLSCAVNLSDPTRCIVSAPIDIGSSMLIFKYTVLYVRSSAAANVTYGLITSNVSRINMTSEQQVQIVGRAAFAGRLTLTLTQSDAFNLSLKREVIITPFTFNGSQGNFSVITVNNVGTADTGCAISTRHAYGGTNLQVILSTECTTTASGSTSAKNLSKGELAGIIIGSAVGLGLIIALCAAIGVVVGYVSKRKRDKHMSAVKGVL